METTESEIGESGISGTSEILELAEIGKNARVVFHDLANHITALSLSIKNLENGFARDSERLSEYSRRSEVARQRMEYIASLLRSHIEKTPDTEFDPGEEIIQVIESFRDKAEVFGIEILIKTGKISKMTGNRRAFVHIITNLVSNAIDAFRDKQKDPRKIVLNLTNSDDLLKISILDTGCGID